MAKNWNDEEEDHIREHFLTQTYGELAEHFGVTTKAMESKIRRMGLKKQEILAETADPTDLEPAAEVEEPAVPEEQLPTPIESIHTLTRRTEVREETPNERKARLKATRDAAEREKARREEDRSAAPISKAVKKFEVGMKKLMTGKSAQAAADFRTILDDPPADLTLVTRARQFLLAAEAEEPEEPRLTSAEDLYNHGVVQLNAGDLEGAIDSLGKAAKKAPKDDRVFYVQAAAYAQSGDFEAALEALSKAIESNDANRIYARNESDFIPLRVHQEFQALVAPPEPPEEEQA